MTQNEMILRHLQTGKSITPVEALSEYGCMRLASRISDIERMTGETIARRKRSRKNRFGKRVSYCEYWMEVGR